LTVVHPKITLSTMMKPENYFVCCRQWSRLPGKCFIAGFRTLYDNQVQRYGLGLAIVKKIVEEHGGRINIENHLSGGAHINIRLPLTEEA